MNELAGKVYVVTGAGNGIGRRVAHELVGRGATVAGVDLSADGLAETAGGVADSSRFTAHTLDISDKAAVAAFPEQILDVHGHVDGLFNIAGIPQPVETLAETSDERIEKIMSVNYFGTVWMTRAFLPHLSDRPNGATILITSSLSAIAPFPGAATYGASKAAVAMFGYGLRQDLRGMKSKVTVTTVIPGTIWTDIVRDTAASLGQKEALARNFAMKPEKAAHVIVESALKGRGRVVIGPDAHVFSGAGRLSNRLADRMSYLQVGTFVYRPRRKAAGR